MQGSTDGSTWESNKQILNEKLDCNCTDSYSCACGNLYAEKFGNVIVYGKFQECDIFGSGFYCLE